MTHDKVKHIMLAIVAFLLFSSLSLWAWNTLADLFTWPNAQYKHIVAAMTLTILFRWILMGDLRSNAHHKINSGKVAES